MGITQLRCTARSVLFHTMVLIGFCWILSGRLVVAQVDQGAIDGVVKDATGAVLQGAEVTLTNIDTNFALKGVSDEKGEYTFSPIKIGNYKLIVTAPGFKTTTQENVHLNIQDRLNISIILKPGAVTESVTVTGAPPLLQNEASSVGQVISTDTINDTPLNGRNYVYIAQLTAGVDPAINGLGRGALTGDFAANGQRTTQNDFVLDGIDNNVDADDLMNGASYNVRPPPDALAEFKIQTSNYSAEFGHSAGAVVNASLKSGTNDIHGDLWEYVRNTALDAADWDGAPNAAGTAIGVPPYHQNQFGATLGFPVWKSKLFYFGDAEANRIAYSQPNAGHTVPTALMRTGDFTELFNTNLTGHTKPIGVFAPNSDSSLPLTCTQSNAAAPPGGAVTVLTGVQGPGVLLDPADTANGGDPSGVPTTNVLCPGQMATAALTLLKQFPLPNVNNGNTYSNYNTNTPLKEDFWQWDQRLDWNISAKDQSYARYSYTHQQNSGQSTFGPVIDGGSPGPGFNGAANSFNMGESFMLSETHIFTPTLINEVRIGYNWGNYQALQENSNIPASKLDPALGGVPVVAGNGGLPWFAMAETNSFGSPTYLPSIEHQNTEQLDDNITKQWKNHSFKFGFQIESIRASINQPPIPRGQYHYANYYTANASARANTGWDLADLLTDNMLNTKLSPDYTASYYRWYRAGYAQDDWKVNTQLTVNLGVRYDLFQPISNNQGTMANFLVTSQGIGTGTGILELPSKVQNQNLLPASFLANLALSNVSVKYVDSNSLVTSQKTNFAPRLGFAYRLDDKTVVRGGYGIFFAGIEVPGAAEMTVNYPFGGYIALVNNNHPCTYGPNNCQSTATADTNQADGKVIPYPTTLETGFSEYLAQGGIASFANGVTFNGSVPNVQTPYTQSYNLTFERSLTTNLVASLGYVGNNGKHLYTGNGVGLDNANAITGVLPGSPSYLAAEPFPHLSGGEISSYNGISMYNSMQAKLEKRYSQGLSFLATYTWSHAGDNSSNPGIGVGPGTRNTNLIPFKEDFTNSSYDTRQRVTFNGTYALPFGVGQKYAHNGGLMDEVVGGWKASLTWAAQSGTPFTVFTDGNTANGGGAYPYLIRNPYLGGGTPDPSQIAEGFSGPCPTKVHNKTNWYNPCAFANPWDPTLEPHIIPNPTNATHTPNVADGSAVTEISQVKGYLGGRANQIYGPGYERVNMSAFKNFKTIREQYVQFRADCFNLFNHPSWLNPNGDTSNDPGGGNITAAQTFQALTPDARFFQIAAKYVF